MKNIFLKLFLFVILFTAGLSFYSGKTLSQTNDSLEIYTDGYSMLGPSAFVLLGGYYDGVGDKKFTTYFEYRKDNSGLKYDSDDLLNQWNLNKDIENTIKMDHSKSPRLLGLVPLEGITIETGNYDISAELNLFSTYYFRAVGYRNDSPGKKFYGSTFSIRTGYIPPGWSVPFTVREGDIETIIESFDPNSVLPGIFARDVGATTAKIQGTLYNKNPQNLRIKVAYGEEEYDFDSEFLLIGKDGKFSVTLKDLKPNTPYYFTLWDTEGNLEPSPEGFFRTISNELPGVFASEITDTTAMVKVILDRKTFLDDRTGKSPKLKVEYGKSDFDMTSELMSLKPKGVTQIELSVVLKNLTPNAGYYFRLIDTEGKYDPSPEGRFTTLKAGAKVPEPKPQIVSTVYNINPRSVLVRANVYNVDPANLELRVHYGVGDLVAVYDRDQDAYRYNNVFTNQSSTMEFDDSGNASVTLSGLEPETEYHFIIVDEKDINSVLSSLTPPESGQTFTTLSERGTGSVSGEEEETQSSAEPEGWVKCFNTNENDKCDFNAFIDLINRMIRIILFDLSVPFAAIMFMYAGFEVLTAGSNPEKLGTAKNIFTNVGIGLAIVASAFIIVETVLFILLDPSYGFIEFLAK